MPDLIGIDELRTVEVIQQSSTIQVVQPEVQVIEIVERGPQGPPGPVADLDTILEQVDVVVQDYFVLHPQTFTFEQTAPVTVCTILHPLDHRPAVTVTDTAGDECDVDISWPSGNTVRVESNQPLAFFATLT